MEVANPLVERETRTVRGRLEQVLKIDINITDPIFPWVVRLASWLLNWYRVKLDGSAWSMARQSGKVRHLIADADGVQIARSMQRPPMQHRWNSQKVKDLVGNQWEMTPKKTKLMKPKFPRRYITRAMVHKHGHYPGCKSSHGLLGGHRRSSAVERRATRFEATAGTAKDARQTSSTATTTVTLPQFSEWANAKFEWTSTSDKPVIGFDSSGRDSDQRSRISSSTRAYAVSAKQDCLVGCPRSTLAAPTFRQGWDGPRRGRIFNESVLRQHEKVSECHSNWVVCT